MQTSAKLVLIIAAIVTVAGIAVWQFTGGDYYTKFEVVEQMPQPADPDDPFAGTGFYDDNQPLTRTELHSEFRFGLFPTPNRLFDKHLISVTSILPPIWCFVLGWLWWRKHKVKRKR